MNSSLKTLQPRDRGREETCLQGGAFGWKWARVQLLGSNRFSTRERDGAARVGCRRRLGSSRRREFGRGSAE